MSTEKPRNLGVFSFFEAVPQPRVERTRHHPLPNILIIAMLTMICVGEGSARLGIAATGTECLLSAGER